MQAIAEVDKDTFRQQTLEVAKRHKASWIEFGQYLFTVHKDKLYRDWGFLSFETYCVKELKIKQPTAMKLVKSYQFLEREEPRLVDPKFQEEAETPKAPNYESVNLLRLARENKKIEAEDYADLRESVIEKDTEPKDFRAQVKKLLSDRDPQDPIAERRLRRNAAIRRVITILGSVRRELEAEKLLPAYLFKQMVDLSSKLQDQIED